MKLERKADISMFGCCKSRCKVSKMRTFSCNVVSALNQKISFGDCTLLEESTVPNILFCNAAGEASIPSKKTSISLGCLDVSNDT
jgi:hypothetical protein